MKSLILGLVLIALSTASYADIKVEGRYGCPLSVTGAKIIGVVISELHGEPAVLVTLKKRGHSIWQVAFTGEDRAIGASLVGKLVPKNQPNFKNRVNYSCKYKGQQKISLSVYRVR